MCQKIQLYSVVLACFLISMTVFPTQAAANKAFHIHNCSSHKVSIDIYLIKFGGKTPQHLSGHGSTHFKCAHHKCDLAVHWDSGGFTMPSGSDIGEGQRIFQKMKAGSYLFDIKPHSNVKTYLALKRVADDRRDDCSLLTDDDYDAYMTF